MNYFSLLHGWKFGLKINTGQVMTVMVSGDTRRLIESPKLECQTTDMDQVPSDIISPRNINHCRRLDVTVPLCDAIDLSTWNDNDNHGCLQ